MDERITNIETQNKGESILLKERENESERTKKERKKESVPSIFSLLGAARVFLRAKDVTLICVKEMTNLLNFFLSVFSLFRESLNERSHLTCARKKKL
jgi:hypothetical protein|tara:strand:- start:304 stop:597 length:294 start_codon:yes stop_codon:yes gene_type:complete